MSNLATRKAARSHYKSVAKHSKPGSGARFKAVEASAKASGASNPGAVAAAIGRKKYGNKKMASMSAHGKKKHGEGHSHHAMSGGHHSHHSGNNSSGYGHKSALADHMHKTHMMHKHKKK